MHELTCTAMQGAALMQVVEQLAQRNKELQAASAKLQATCAAVEAKATDVAALNTQLQACCLVTGCDSLPGLIMSSCGAPPARHSPVGKSSSSRYACIQRSHLTCFQGKAAEVEELSAAVKEQAADVHAMNAQASAPMLLQLCVQGLTESARPRRCGGVNIRVHDSTPR